MIWPLPQWGSSGPKKQNDEIITYNNNINEQLAIYKCGWGVEFRVYQETT